MQKGNRRGSVPENYVQKIVVRILEFQRRIQIFGLGCVIQITRTGSYSYTTVKVGNLCLIEDTDEPKTSLYRFLRITSTCFHEEFANFVRNF